MIRNDIRNIVIIAHVDHGKTTLVDCMLKQSGQFREGQLSQDQILDSNELERERGITILAKNIAINYKDVKINVIDTPGHADFGGEVERVLQMADGALVLVDAAEGPMPQTRFVLSKAIEVGLQPIVVVNKIDKPDARALEVVDETFELILELGGDSYLENLSHIFTSAKEGYATFDPEKPSDTIAPLMDMILEKVAPPNIEERDTFCMMTTTIDWSEFVGRIAIGRIQSGTVRKGLPVLLMQADGKQKSCKVASVMVFDNLGRTEVAEASAGEVVALIGMEGVEIGDTITSPENPIRLPRLKVDQPTLEMLFSTNSSPLAGREGKFVTGRQVRERLMKELERNVALQLRSDPDNSDAFRVAGRGLLHLSILIETMRREGYELSVAKPQVVFKTIDGVKHEPFEILTAEVPTEKFGPVMEMVGARRGEIKEMKSRGDYTLATFLIPSRGLIGLRTRLLNATQGTAIINHRFESYQPLGADPPRRPNGVMISMANGKALAFAIDGLQQRAEMFIKPGDEIYEGMIVGENARGNDLPVNPIKAKKLTNMRASGSDDNVILKPPKIMSLEMALEYIEDDELVEITPSTIRLRKLLLREADRRRMGRATVGT